MASAAGLLLSLFAWVQAVRLPDYGNYWEWHVGWHVGVRNGGTRDRPAWWDTYAFVGQFPDRGVLPTPPPDMLVSPYRWPDLRAREVRLLWPAMLSLVAPVIGSALRFRREPDARGFSVCGDGGGITRRCTGPRPRNAYFSSHGRRRGRGQ